MTTLREVAQQALEAMESADVDPHSSDAVYKAITALRAALADGDKLSPGEPVAWLTPRTVDSYSRPDLGYETSSKTDYGAFPVYTAPPQRPAEPVQEPVGEVEAIDEDKEEGTCHAIVALYNPVNLGDRLYTAPPQQRKPLTEEEIQAAWDSVDMRHPRGNETRIAFARAIERAHGIGVDK